MSHTTPLPAHRDRSGERPNGNDVVFAQQPGQPFPTQPAQPGQDWLHSPAQPGQQWLPVPVQSGQQWGPAPVQAGPQWINRASDQYVKPFAFDGGAGNYLGMAILSTLLVVFTIGLAAPWAICMQYRWQANHTLIYGRRVHFTGKGGGLFGNWIKWLLLCIITLGIYSFWVAPRLTKWVVEHQDFS